MTATPTKPLRAGDAAPDIMVPAATREGVISLHDYRGQSPLFLALFRGLY